MTDNALKSQFLLDPAVTYLNHGSFGACPRPVFEAYQQWQRKLEENPVLFMGQIGDLLAESRARLASYVNADPRDLVYFQNPTSAFNAVARSLAVGHGPLALRPGDEVLTTDHEYGAMDRTWRYVCRQTGARYVRQRISLPVTSHRQFVEELWAGVSGQTRVIFLSHVTSPTALIFPVQEICQRARAAGILSVVDGAHAPGQIPVDLSAIGADVYIAACHKWMCAPKGSAFLYARPEIQPWLEPLIVSFGWNDELPGQGKFLPFYEMQGTRDPAAYLSVPAAIHFMSDHQWPEVQKRCRALALQTRERIIALTGLPPICPATNEWMGQFFAARLPTVDAPLLSQRLAAEYKIIVPCYQWNDKPFIRVSVQAYNTSRDLDALIDALAVLLPELGEEREGGGSRQTTR